MTTTDVAAPMPDLLSVLSRAATDKECDPAKMKAMLDVMLELQREKAKQEFGFAMSGAQADMQSIAPDAFNPQTRSRYATYQKLDEALRPIYTRHGFSLSFTSEKSDAPDVVPMVCYVSHKGGFTREYRLVLPADGKGARGGDVMTKTHAVGSATQYGMRYLLKMIFNVAIDRDDDGNAAGGGAGKRAGADLINALRQAAKAAGRDEAKICQVYGVRALDDLTESNARAALDLCKKHVAAPAAGHDALIAEIRKIMDGAPGGVIKRALAELNKSYPGDVAVTAETWPSMEPDAKLAEFKALLIV